MNGLVVFPTFFNLSLNLAIRSSWSEPQLVPGLVLVTVIEPLPGFLVAQTGKCLPAIRETWVRSLGWEDPLEKEMATHSSTLAWKIPWTEDPGGLQSMGSQRVRHD